MLVWYPSGVAKLADAAIITAITNGSAATPILFVIDRTMGMTRTAAALLVITSVRTDTTR